MEDDNKVVTRKEVTSRLDSLESKLDLLEANIKGIERRLSELRERIYQPIGMGPTKKSA